MIVTEQMVRDHLTFAGPTTIDELARILKLDNNNLQLILLDLQEKQVVDYNIEAGTWVSKIVLS